MSNDPKPDLLDRLTPTAALGAAWGLTVVTLHWGLYLTATYGPEKGWPDSLAEMLAQAAALGTGGVLMCGSSVVARAAGRRTLNALNLSGIRIDPSVPPPVTAVAGMLGISLSAFANYGNVIPGLMRVRRGLSLGETVLIGGIGLVCWVLACMLILDLQQKIIDLHEKTKGDAGRQHGGGPGG